MLHNLRKRIAAGLIALAARIDPTHIQRVDVSAPQLVEIPREPGRWTGAYSGPSPIRAAWPVCHEAIQADLLASEAVQRLLDDWYRQLWRDTERMAGAPAPDLDALNAARAASEARIAQAFGVPPELLSKKEAKSC